MKFQLYNNHLFKYWSLRKQLILFPENLNVGIFTQDQSLLVGLFCPLCLHLIIYFFLANIVQTIFFVAHIRTSTYAIRASEAKFAPESKMF